MIALIVGIVLAIIGIQIAAGMWIGRWLYPPEPKQNRDANW